MASFDRLRNNMQHQQPQESQPSVEPNPQSEFAAWQNCMKQLNALYFVQIFRLCFKSLSAVLLF